MAKRIKKKCDNETERPKRAKLSPEESLKRMQDFPKRKAQFIAAVRTGRPGDYLPELR